MHHDTLHLTCNDLTLKVFTADNGAETGLRLTGTAYGGGIVNYGGQRIVIDISSTRTPEQCPVLLEHDREKRIGIASLSKDSHHIGLNGSLLKQSPLAQQIATDAQDGFPFELSIGIFNALSEPLPQGSSATVNGQSVQGPLNIYRNGIIREVSIVTLGADTTTHVAIFNQPESTSMELNAALAQISELQGQKDTLSALLNTTQIELKVQTEECARLKAELEKAHRDARLADIQRDFAALGFEPTEEDTASYLTLSADQYNKVMGHLKNIRLKIPESYFREQATQGNPIVDPNFRTVI